MLKEENLAPSTNTTTLVVGKNFGTATANFNFSSIESVNDRLL